MKRNLLLIIIVILLVLSLGTNTYLYRRIENLEKSGTGGSTTGTVTNQVDMDVKDDTTDIVEKVSGSVVTIEVAANGMATGSGSGVVFQKEGDDVYIVTNHHVVDGGDSITILFNSGDSTNAELLGSDQYTDLAVLKVNPDFEVTPIEIGDSNLLDVGETVLAIGSPLGSNYNGSTTKGIISGTNRVVGVDLNGDGMDDWDMSVLQTDAAINPGNSGGALINMAGELVGITSMKISDTDGMGFAIPISDALNSIEQLKTDGKIERPVLGIQAIAMNNISLFQRYYNHIESTSSDGIYIVSVQNNSPADKGGLKAGDIVTELDGTEITTYKSFLQALYEHHIGDTITLKIDREGSTETLTVTLE